MTITPAARDLYNSDPSASHFGIELISASPDSATVRMNLTGEMCNGFGIGHGGMTFLLADSAMAFASNASGGTALATSAAIDWFAPARHGDTLTATCTLRHGTGRSKVWNITVANQHDATIAAFTGRTRLTTSEANR